MSQSEQVKPDSAQVERIQAELHRARLRQRTLYMLAGSGLLLALLFTFTLIAFSNATAIEVKPADARESAELKLVGGFGLCVGNAVYSLSTMPVVEVSATGFKTLRRVIQEAETGGTVTVELAELPGLLHMRTEPPSENTRWHINGALVQLGSELEQELAKGTHQLLIDSPYFKKTALPVTLQRGEKLEKTVTLESISGAINIKTKPAGASVFVNGEPAGQSPLSLAKAGGKYRIEVKYGDYQPVSESVEITNAETAIDRFYWLALKEASLHVSVSPAGGRLLLDGKAVPASGPLSVKAGVNHTLIYLKDGYFTRRKTVSLAPGAEQKIAFKLKAEFGTVSFISSPAATVNLDGRDMGRTPLTLKLPAVAHRLLLHKQGYRSYRQTVKPSSQSSQQVNVVLLSEAKARLAEAPNSYSGPVGLEFRLFKPADTFVMGAPRHEKGQRANEFLRTVKLTMPFYVSKREVTRSQFSRFRQTKGVSDEPVTSVSWIEAARFCNWLSRQENRTPFYDIQAGRLVGANITSDGYRLPTEAEWEWLARKALRSKQTRFTWGNETTIPASSGNIADEFAKGKTTFYVPNYSDGFAGLAPVGSFPPEPSGLYDLTGNASEWVHDVYGLIPPDAQNVEIDPVGESRGETHTVKGSNWRSGTLTELRASYREGDKAGRDDIGFRVARYVFGGRNGQ